jgi:hypothetical protein
VTERKKPSLRPEFVLAGASIITLLIGLEIASRIWVGLRWNDGERAALIERPTSVAGYIFDPETGYRLQPDISRSGRRRSFTHNHLGLRALSNFEHRPGPGVVRIAIMGASTIYGIYVDDAETSSVRLGEWLKQRHPDLTFEVINAGVPGWTTRESLINLKRVLELEPDIIVVADGRNEIFAQLFDNYRDDYSHYRRIGYDFRDGNRIHKAIFRASYFAMLLTTTRGQRFGYSSVNENPPYGYLRWENKPEPDDIVRNGEDTTRTRGFRSNLQTLIERAEARGVRVVLSSLPFHVERFASGVFLPNPKVLPVLDRFAEMNNRITRMVAQSRGLPFVDGASLSKPELLFDDCHFRPVGEQLYAALMGRAIEPLLPEITARRPRTSTTEPPGRD